MVCVPESMLPGKNRFRRTCITANMYKTYLWLVGNGGMEYNYNYYDYHSSIPYQPKAGKLRLWDISFYSIIGTLRYAATDNYAAAAPLPSCFLTYGECCWTGTVLLPKLSNRGKFKRNRRHINSLCESHSESGVISSSSSGPEHQPLFEAPFTRSSENLVRL